ncbi:hypothetical protein X756_02505 [Mesorhizobium sp. LSHC412B00]|nr:hypothetical protein X756_02505 [Mesorhizobium sp. LSHC412B00]
MGVVGRIVAVGMTKALLIGFAIVMAVAVFSDL